MQKAMKMMNICLTNVLSDITGITGMKIIRAIIDGERRPEVLASYRHGQCANSEDVIKKSLEGNYKRENVFALKQALELYDFYDKQMQKCDEELKALYEEFDQPNKPGTEPPVKRNNKRRKNQPHFDLAKILFRMTDGIDLTQIDGLDELSDQNILSETSTDMNKWPTAKHFTSWLCLAPNNLITGGKIKNSRTQPTQNRASNAFRIAAQSLSRSECTWCFFPSYTCISWRSKSGYCYCT